MREHEWELVREMFGLSLKKWRCERCLVSVWSTNEPGVDEEKALVTYNTWFQDELMCLATTLGVNCDDESIVLGIMQE